MLFSFSYGHFSKYFLTNIVSVIRNKVVTFQNKVFPNILFYLFADFKGVPLTYEKIVSNNAFSLVIEQTKKLRNRIFVNFYKFSCFHFYVQLYF